MATAQLNVHLNGNNVMVTAARHQFVLAEQKSQHEFENGDREPVRRASAQERLFSVSSYYDSVGLELPVLAMLGHLLDRMAATEASVERVFSDEKFIHSIRRNRLDQALVADMLQLRRNLPAMQRLTQQFRVNYFNHLKGLFVPDDPDSESDGDDSHDEKMQ